ncbi:hypothetical protein GCM10011519_07320 [Marmoricola endophyticus]|uniref:Uncharacterized protein n=1 Tax=Marmoricola endophyticus TaxID=2040280 RepID=A0A917F1S4_9ACTN|nr:hypothetical protein [Marmoricola endophyticus]GGF36349.1 hypothetical protein GCM10011519_07320 [Marmoricola endophyticus]
MPVRECQNAFAAAAAADGVALTAASVPWLNGRGHLGIADDFSHVKEVLANIFEALGGQPDELASKPMRRLSGDFVHAPTGTFIEVDERQHFTSHRLKTLDLYPSGARLGFDIEEYRDLCRGLAAKADRDFAHKAAAGFGPGGRPRQRAYNDALRDLVTPSMELPPVIRVAAPDRDGVAAYERVRDSLKAL